jgi:hypothetical protein
LQEKQKKQTLKEIIDKCKTKQPPEKHQQLEIEEAIVFDAAPTPPWFTHGCTCQGDDICDFCAGVNKRLAEIPGTPIHKRTAG